MGRADERPPTLAYVGGSPPPSCPCSRDWKPPPPLRCAWPLRVLFLIASIVRSDVSLCREEIAARGREGSAQPRSAAAAEGATAPARSRAAVVCARASFLGSSADTGVYCADGQTQRRWRRPCRPTWRSCDPPCRATSTSWSQFQQAHTTRWSARADTPCCAQASEAGCWRRRAGRGAARGRCAAARAPARRPPAPR